MVTYGARPVPGWISFPWLALLTAGLFVTAHAGTPPGGSHEINLRSRSFLPEAGVDSALRKQDSAGHPVHVFVQLHGPLTPPTLRDLEESGIRLLEYLQGTTYIAALRDAGSIATRVLHVVRWVGPIQPRDKLDPAIAGGQYPEYARNADGTVNVVVAFHADVAPVDQLRTLTRLGLSPRTEDLTAPWPVRMSPSTLEGLLREDTVEWVEPGPKPQPLAIDRTRVELNADAVQGASLATEPPTYAGLSGSGVRIGIVDTGVNADHDDFWNHDANGNRTSSRVILHSPHVAHFHGTHVASLAAGNGFQSHRVNSGGTHNGSQAYRFRGIAPQASIFSYDKENVRDRWGTRIYSVWRVMFDSLVVRRADLTNHSYHSNCGEYDLSSASLETITRGDARVEWWPIPSRAAVWAAGNEGESPFEYCNRAGYFSITQPAKNVITVGGTTDYLVPPTRWSFSSMGPTRDGRLKPDVVAPGCHIVRDAVFDFSGIRAAGMSNNYVGICGTSMAAGIVTGTSALLVEQWKKSGALTSPRSSTVKAALIHGARDMIDEVDDPPEVSNPDTENRVHFHAGPDYATGYGEIDVAASATAIAEGRVIENLLTAHGDTLTFIVPEGTPRFRVTIAWDDLPASMLSSDLLPKLVNDLDLTLIDPNGTAHLPWVLPVLTPGPDDSLKDPISEADLVPATPGMDRRNNVEQVEIRAPMPGRWFATVKPYAMPQLGRQFYSLASDVGVARPARIPTRYAHCSIFRWRGFAADVPAGIGCAILPVNPVCAAAAGCNSCDFNRCHDSVLRIAANPLIERVELLDDNFRPIASAAMSGRGAILQIAPEALAGAQLAIQMRGSQGKSKAPIPIEVTLSGRERF